jgi:branched-chain amino acid transport system substrate-binding protein
MTCSFLRGARATGFASIVLAVWLVTLTVRPGVGLAQGTPTEIKIGGTISLSGRFKPIVGPFKALAEAWAERVNREGGILLSKYGKKLPVRFIILDDESDQAKALSLYEKLATDDKVDLFIGPFSSVLNSAAVQAAMIHKVPYFVPEGNDSKIYETENPWRTTGLAPAEKEYDRLAELYEKLGGLKTFAILSSDDLHANASAKAFGENLKKRGFQVVYQDSAPPSTTDFSSILLKIKQANPDAVMVEAIAPGFSIGFAKQAREQGIASKEFIVGHMPVPVIKALGPGAENVMAALYFYDGDSPDHKAFFEVCKAANIEPWQYSESGIRYRTYRRIEEALKKAGTLDKEAVRKAMWEANFELFGSERMKVDSRGYGTDVPYPSEVKDGKMVPLWPLDKAVKMHAFKDGKW